MKRRILRAGNHIVSAYLKGYGMRKPGSKIWNLIVVILAVVAVLGGQVVEAESSALAEGA